MTDKEIIDALRAEIAELKHIVLQQAQINAQQAALIKQLQAAQSSKTSHFPPSQDSPKARSERKRRVRTTSARKQGAQPGHDSSHRQMLDSDEVDHIVACEPAHCGECGDALTGESIQMSRHQVWEIPPVEPIVTEYQLHKKVCACGCATWATLPEGHTVGASQFGPRVHAIAATLRTQARSSVSVTRDLLFDMFGITMSTGSVSAMDHRISQALESDHALLHEALKSSEVAHLDETTWYLQGSRHNLWAGVFKEGTCILARAKRDQLTAQELVGEDFEGIAVTDRYSAYHWLDDSRRQMCWAHLLRDFEAMSQHEGVLGAAGGLLKIYTEELLCAHRRVRDGTLDFEEFAAQVGEKRAFMEQLLRDAGRSRVSKKWGGAAREIMRHVESLWTCLGHEDVAPTNNAAERALRHGVIARKLSFGSQSERGLRWAERVLSVYDTLRRQKRSFFAYMVATLQGHQPALLTA